VLFNLGENAVKYAGAGRAVTLRVGVEGTAAVLAVRDTGPGIAAAEHARIFDRFYRADPARERGGTGLGLPLARSIVRLHGGEITVESGPAGGVGSAGPLPDGSLRAAKPDSLQGQGTCFHVRLPLATDTA
jgi:signal transduction histidine kinase